MSSVGAALRAAVPASAARAEASPDFSQVVDASGLWIGESSSVTET